MPSAPSPRGGQPRAATAVLPPLLLAALVLLLAGAPSPARAAAVTEQQQSTVQRRNPSVVAHLGEQVPLTLYIRLKRQIQYSFLGGAGTAAPLAVEVEPVEVDADGDVVETVDGQSPAPVREELPAGELKLPSLGAATGKHKNQLVRALPPTHCPRFGINKAVTLLSNQTLRIAGASLASDPTLQQSNIAFRFSVGRGLQKESTWLPLAARRRYTNLLSAMLAGWMLDAHAAKAAEAAAERHRGEEGAAGEAAADAAAAQVQYLSRLTFYFGYQKGELQKMTSFSVNAQYSNEVKAGVELHYVWNEHRPYNPNRAVTLCSAVAVLVAMIAAVAVFHPSGRSMLLFSQRIVAVRAHD